MFAKQVMERLWDVNHRSGMRFDQSSQFRLDLWYFETFSHMNSSCW
jgi:hypothetical protein